MNEVFYFTYGTEGQPFYGGWTEIHAPSRAIACDVFRMHHPDKTPGLLNCSSVYDREEFNRTTMSGPGGNFGFYAHEIIEVSINRVDGSRRHV